MTREDPPCYWSGYVPALTVLVRCTLLIKATIHNPASAEGASKRILEIQIRKISEGIELQDVP